MLDNSTPELVISGLKDKCFELYQSVVRRQEEKIQTREMTEGKGNVIDNSKESKLNGDLGISL
jgi:hypothetical protein